VLDELFANSKIIPNVAKNKIVIRAFFNVFPYVKILSLIVTYKYYRDWYMDGKLYVENVEGGARFIIELPTKMVE
jgi:hypothetical protein